MQPDIASQTKTRLQKVIEVIKDDVATIRTGRATPSVVEHIVVSAYAGSTHMRVMELATIAATDQQTLVITPFDSTIIQEISKGIQDANVGFNPIVDGQIIRISIPPLTQDRREELIKSMRHKLENGKIMVRQVRHESMEDVKKQHTDKKITDDDKSRLDKEIQKIIDEHTSLIESIGKLKEEELLQL